MSLTQRLLAYHDSLGNAESKALLKDVMAELSRRTWREALAYEALRGLADTCRWQVRRMDGWGKSHEELDGALAAALDALTAIAARETETAQ
jgi:hypothetical protein